MKSYRTNFSIKRLSLLSLIICIYSSLCGELGYAHEYSLGITFGSPGLVGVRTQLHDIDSDWIFQLDYSEQVLFHNRTNGFLKTYRFDIQRFIWSLDQLSVFYFLGLDYFKGYYNKYSPTINLLGMELGGGIHLQVTQRLFSSIEIGGIIPTQSVIGFEKYGIITLFGLGFGW